METVKIRLLDKNGDVQYGLNWGHRENRDKNQSYLQLPSDVYKSDFFPKKGTYFLVTTDDGEVFAMNRAQKTDDGTAIQTPENNAILGKYLRTRLGLSDGKEITLEDILSYGRIDFTVCKIDDRHYTFDFNKNWSSNDLAYLYEIFLYTVYYNNEEGVLPIDKIKTDLSYSSIENVATYSNGEFTLNLPESQLPKSFVEFISSDFLYDHYSTEPEKTTMLKSLNISYQIIFYGAPGTGKSHKVNEIVKGNDDLTFRTTFHPDTDYAAFVGSYKPVVNKKSLEVESGLSIDQLAEKLKKWYADAPIKTLGLHSFIMKYIGYFNGEIAEYSKKDICLKAGLTADYQAEVNKIVNLHGWMSSNGYLPPCSEISYEFVPQTFTNAYVAAWLNPNQHVYLVIEEINRGNCAQIFGDLFQLLDRKKTGESEYPIKADTDLRKYLEDIDILGPCHEGIKDGNLRLPKNLHILATMNTSDQSLFPMDSAFKRRWDWEYVPSDPNCEESQFKITIGKYTYNWAEFMVKANARILDLSESEDKQMGNFFIKDDLDEDKFKSKVMFYLWSEVCKDFYKNGSFFKNADAADKEFTFNELFPKNETTTATLNGFMKYLGLTGSASSEGKHTDVDAFVTGIEELGASKVFDLGIEVNGLPLVGKTEPVGHAFRRSGEFYIQTTVEDKDALLSEIKSKLL